MRLSRVLSTNSGDECHQLATVRWHAVYYNTWRSHCWQRALKRDQKSIAFFIPHLHSTPHQVVHVGILPTKIWYGKTRKVWLSDCENKFEDTITHFDIAHKRDRDTDRQTDTARLQTTQQNISLVDNLIGLSRDKVALYSSSLPSLCGATFEQSCVGAGCSCARAFLLKLL